MANHYNAEAIYWGGKRVTPPLRAARRHARPDQRRALRRGRGTSFVLGRRLPGARRVLPQLRRMRRQHARRLSVDAVPRPRAAVRNQWYASTEGSNVARFTRTLSRGNRISSKLTAAPASCTRTSAMASWRTAECIPRSRALMQRLSRKNGWFVPVGDAARSPAPRPRAGRHHRRAAQFPRAPLAVAEAFSRHVVSWRGLPCFDSER